MESIKTLFLAALLSAAAYGVYVTVTGSPPPTPPKDAPQEWENPQVELPGEIAQPVGATTPADAVATASPPLGNAAPPFDAAPTADAPPSYPSTDPPSAAPPFGAAEPAAEAPRYPSTDPSESAPDGDRYQNQFAAGEPTGTVPGYPDYPTETGSMETGVAPARYEQQTQPSQDAEPSAEFAAVWDAALYSLEQHRLADAQLALSEWYGSPLLTPEQDAQLNELLDRLAGTVIYSRQHLLERPHEVQPGETLDRIAELYEVPWQLLANINGLRDPQRIRSGEQLKVVRGPFNAVVELNKFRLTLFVDGRYAGRFRIGIGKDESTPEGEFDVLQKITNPTYYGDPVIDADDPNNPLGEYALDLGDHILIHGTNAPSSIGRAESKGCIRLDNRDIKDVFDILSAKSDRSAGSKITIRR